jgi:hypothetical protein
MTREKANGEHEGGQEATDRGHSPPECLGDDLLVGAEAIARELSWKTADGRWNRRRVYYLAEQGNVPIHRVKGIGVCARRSALKAFFDALDARLLEKLDKDSEAA